MTPRPDASTTVEPPGPARLIPEHGEPPRGAAEGPGEDRENNVAGGWFAVPDAGWNDAMAELRKMLGEHQLPRAIAIADLRWWARQCLAPESIFKAPTSRACAERWGWGEKRARLLLADEDSWVDPRERDRWNEYRGRTEDAAAPQAGRTEDAPPRASSGVVADAGRTEDAAAPQAGREKGDTRVVVTPDPRPLTPTKKKSRTVGPTSLDEQRIWDSYTTAFANKKPTMVEWASIQSRLNDKRTAEFAAEHSTSVVELLARYVAWLAGPAQKPTYLREQGLDRSKTPWRDEHFESYCLLMLSPPAGEAKAVQADLQAEAGRAWDHVGSLLRHHTTEPADPIVNGTSEEARTKERAVRAGIRSVGWTRLRQAGRDDDRTNRTIFTDAYVAARTGRTA